MPQLVTPFSAQGPLLTVELRAAGQKIGLLAMVDSGATRSFFPKETAKLLGLDPNRLVQDAGGATGVEGGSFPTWSATVPVEVQIVRIDPQTQQASFWGPSIPMTPAFAEKQASLLGREDFFPAFGIQFGSNAQIGPHFIIEH